MQSFVPLVCEYRGDLLDLTHMGYVCVVDEHSNVVLHLGDPQAKVFYRSASKPIQALPTIARRLDEAYGLTEEETALFAGSHAGEPFHLAALSSLFQKAGLEESWMVMNPAGPAAAYANEERIRQGLPPRKFYHNCAGKHASLLLLQRALGAPVQSYWRMDAAAQQEVLRCVSILSECPQEQISLGIDGCGVPVFAVPLRCMAASFKNLARPDRIRDEALSQAAARFVPRIHRHPLMIRGTGYRCSRLNEDENIVTKGGSLGVQCIGLKREGLGIAIKLVDGTEDVLPLVIRRVFELLGYNKPETLRALDELRPTSMLNDCSMQASLLRPAF